MEKKGEKKGGERKQGERNNRKEKKENREGGKDERVLEGYAFL